MGAKLNCKNPHAIVLAMGFTGLDAIQFFQDEVKQTRDYCQTPDDQAIRESSFNSDNGWFVWGMVVVTTNAKNKSPITVTSWIADGAMQVIIISLDISLFTVFINNKSLDPCILFGQPEQHLRGIILRVLEQGILSDQR
jgi:hypothetical protein